jgi:hypothetical protein
VLLARLRTADKIDWSRCIVDSSSIRAVGAGQKQDPIPPIAHARLQHHLITEAQGIPLAVILTGANRNDVTQLLPLVEAIPPIRGKRGAHSPSPESSRPTVATITTSTAGPFTLKASRPRSPGATRRTAAAWAKPAGWSSEPSAGSTITDACGFDSSDWPSFTKPLSRSPAASFAGEN